MKYFLGFLSAVLVSLVAATAVHAGDQDEPRFKLSFSGILAGPSQTDITAVRDGSFDFRSGDGLDAWRNNFRREYMVSHGVDPNDYLLYFPSGSRTLCCSTEADWFTMPRNGVSMRPGDEYLMWARRVPGTIQEQGLPMGASLEYRAVGPLWLSFSFQRSRETTLTTTETSEFMRVRGISRVPCSNCTTPSDAYVVESTRNRVIRDSGYGHRSTTFAVLAKLDLTRRNSFWSVLPQAGLNLLRSRDQTITDAQEFQWSIFSGERHPSGAELLEQVGDSRTVEFSEARYHLRPVLALALELYPATKHRHVAIVADGGYHFNPKTFAYEHGGSSYAPYWYNASTRTWTFSLGGLVKF